MITATLIFTYTVRVPIPISFAMLMGLLVFPHGYGRTRSYLSDRIIKYVYDLPITSEN